MLDVSIDSIEDMNTREALRRVLELLNEYPMLRFRGNFKQVEVSAAVTNKRIPHRLGFKPKHVVQLSKTGAGTVTFNYDEFDDTHIDITTSGAASVDFIVGSYNEEL